MHKKIFNIIKTCIFPVISAILCGLAFPKPDIGWLVWIGLVPYFMSLMKATPLEALWKGLVFGIIFFVITLNWITETMVNFGHLPWIVSFLLICVLSTYLAIYNALIAFLCTIIRRRLGTPLTVSLAPTWVSLHFLRGYMLTGFPWSLLGYTQYQWIPMIQMASITSVYGISFLIVQVNVALAQILMRERSFRRTWWPAIGTSILFVIFLGFGWLNLIRSPKMDYLKVAIIQGSVPQEIKWDPAYREYTVDLYLTLSQNVVQKDIDLLIWPEAAMPFRYRFQPEYRKRIEDFVKDNHVHLLFGAPDIKEEKHLNSAFLLSPEGHILEDYSKIHLVPFGEYVPLQDIFFFVRKLVPGNANFKPGQKYTIFPYPGGALSVYICYEAAFPGLVRKFTRDGAQILTTLTNEAWFGRSGGSAQIVAMNALRAAENQRPLLRAANTGISAIYDHHGRILASTELFVTDIILEDVPIPRPPTRDPFFVKYGFVFVYFCILATVLWVGQILIVKLIR